jgi:hypothetical protein
VSHRPITIKALNKALRKVNKLRTDARTIGVLAVCRHCGDAAYMGPQRLCAACVGLATGCLYQGPPSANPRADWRWPEMAPGSLVTRPRIAAGLGVAIGNLVGVPA